MSDPQKAALPLHPATTLVPWLEDLVQGRRIAVLGDMLELGSHSAKLHQALADVLRETRTDLVFLAGPEMKALAETLPPDLVAGYRAGAEELKPVLLDALRPGDYPQAQVLAASLRNPEHLKTAAMLGCEVATVPTAVLRAALAHPLTTSGIEKFTADWQTRPEFAEWLGELVSSAQVAGR